ncbi:MocR-like pyridoxine biosynthesis transcription factor PdxR [Shewanella baltica]|uniref:Transcriptional regulator, GntR family n=1 Tax=Shewanella baltica (strain OS155 / ATCC BAA-1091) TaxID=325240 RepID=A3D9X5_SHEB5|nr:PLP-dependent aminotransferase family protein [Shewanella baltica]ABN63538.1 transcriptional regulator, GntR family [Shewanella baltica OS155]AEH15882.1 transcriptional regulator, GntR family with aminotransferase domain [Shewanella baltica OS117]
MTKVLAYKQVYQRIHTAILQGILKSGERLPSARTLAKEMGVARGTVEEGYAILKAEGYIESKGQAGTVVSRHFFELAKVQTIQLNTRQPGFHTEIETSVVLPFQLGIPALDAFPRQAWSRMAARCARNIQMDDLIYPSVYGSPQLRIAIAQYLQLSRGVKCEPTQVFITSGYVHSINWIAHVLLSPQANVAVEDPGYPLTRKILANQNLNIVPIVVDKEGINLPPNTQADAVIVTPAHQSPTCVSLSLQRRQELLSWAETNQSWIIEDDYDGEYRHTGQPLPALKSLDNFDRVIYSGTFSKVLFPSLRMAYIVVPKSKVSAFEQCSELYAGNVSGLIQACVLAFMQEGHLSRHIQRMKNLYRERRELTARIFKQVLGDKVSIEPQPGGMYMMVKLTDPNIDDAELANKMMKAGLFAQGLSQWSSRPVHPSLILSFTNISTEEECRTLVSRFKDILGQC